MRRLKEKVKELQYRLLARATAQPEKAGLVVAAGGAALLVGTGVAHAITAPTSGSFAYDVYDIAVNKMLDGPIGFVGGMMAMVIGAVAAIQQRIMAAVPCILGGAMLLKADDLITSLGAIF